MVEARPTLPRIVTDLPLDTESVAERLVTAVAHTLDLPKVTIQLFDSFTDLGGDDMAAGRLKQACRMKGIDVKTEDVMGCQTLAELQTRITPYPSTAPVSSGLGESEEPESMDSSDLDDPFSPGRRPATYSVSSYGSIKSKFSTDYRDSSRPNNKAELEDLLSSSTKVDKVCTVTPKAGPFDGQLVALITLSELRSDSEETSLPPASELNSHRKHIHSLRTAVQEWGSKSPRPEVWVILQSMAVNKDGWPDPRELKTWVQNINEDAYEQIMQLQIPEPRRRSTKSQQSRAQSWPEHQTSTWGEDEGSQVDWEESSIPLDEVACFSLSAMQQLYFRTSMNRGFSPSAITEPGYRFSQSILLRIIGGAELADIEAAVEALVSRHDMLRARFRLTDEGWAQVVLPQALNSYRFGHHTADTDDDVSTIVESAQAVINPIEGPVFAAEHVRTADGESLLYLVAHHLVVDLISWRVMTHDLDELLQQGTLFSEGSIPFPHWIDYQSYERTQRLTEPTLPFTITPTNLEYWDLDQRPNLYGDTAFSHFSLTPELSSILQESCKKVFRAEPADVFLTALVLSFNQTFPDRIVPTVWKQEHGRETSLSDFNIMETVGWFTSLCPISIGLGSLDLLQLLKLMKDTRRAIPCSGSSYFTSECSKSGNPITDIPVEVMFNCIDTLQQVQRKDGVLEPVALPGQEARSLNSNVGPKVGRIAIFEVSVLVDGSGAHVEFLFNKYSRHQDRIAAWMERFEHLVLEAVGRLRYHEPELTLSDVPLLKTSYESLAKLATDRLTGLGLPAGVQDIETIYPVTPAQQEILISQGQDPESYQVSGVYQLCTADGGPIDKTRLCDAWEQVVAVHPVMRSIFIDSVSEEGLFDQLVLNKVSPNMLFLDSMNPEKALSDVPSLRTRDCEPRHRLSVCQTMLMTMVRVDASQAICDSTSIHNLVAELSRVYAGQSPYHNEALHRTHLYHISSLETEYSLEVWKADLSDTKPCLFPRLSSSESIQQRSFSLEVSREQLLKFAHNWEMDPLPVLQLAWALVLRAFIGIDHVTFGNQFSGRDEGLLPGIKGAIGSFATNLPCFVEVSASQTVEQCLDFLSAASINANQHQILTMAEIQHALGLKSEALFNTCFSFQGSDLFDGEDIHKSGALKPTMITSARQSDCDLSLTAMFVNDHIHANLSSRYLSNRQAQNVVYSFERAIKAILESPTHQIADIDLFTDRDYAQLVVKDWETTQKSEKVSACLHNLILDHASSHPDAPAICAWDGQTTYRQLATLVSGLKTYLVNAGVGPGMTIPVVLDKNRWAPVIMLAVMQAGACFIALDSQDKITVESTVKQLNPHLVIATETAWRDLGTFIVNLVVVNNAFFSTVATQICLAKEATPEHAACVFISPGKSRTGIVRSIFFTHASLCSTFMAQGPALKINARSRVLQLSSFNVDISLVEILGTMVHGGCVCIPSAKERLDDLPGAIARMGVTWTYMTGVLARRINPATVPSLRTLCFRTRKLDEDTYRHWLQNRDVLLAYGAPDVCPLGISVTEVRKHKDLSTIPPPITGRFWILNPDDSRRLMPIGAIGELAIDSPTVTPHKFSPEHSLIAQPSIDGARPRYLKTGHRVRYLDDGNIQFISSVRDDIVIDGSVVDVAEVERQMRRSFGQGIDVVIDVVTTKDDLKVLAAFLEMGENLFHGSNDLGKLSNSVKEQTFIAKKCFEASLAKPESRIPENCVPAVFIPLKHFPISTSLKINRRKLQRMVTSLSYAQLADMSTISNASEVQHVALCQKPLPLTRPEELMRSIWSRVLSLPPSEITGASNFMSLGGNRFLATEFVVACRKAGLQVSITDVLQGTSLTEVCRRMAASEKSASSHGVASTLTGYTTKFLREVIAPQLQVPWKDIIDLAPASPTQIRNLELAMRSERADITCILLNFNGFIRHQMLESACQALAKMHPALRTAFAIHEQHVYQVLGSSFKPEFATYSCPPSRLESIAEKIVKKDQALTFKPSTPVTKFTFLNAGQQGTLIMSVSKSQIDEASVALLVQDLVSLYGESNRVPEKSSFFEYMRAAQLGNEINGVKYWKEQLEGAKITEIISHHKPSAPSAQIRNVQESVKINSLGAYGMPVEAVIKAAWALVLATTSGQNDVLFGEVIQGHNTQLPDTVDLTSMVGPLANTIPVRVRFPSIHSTPIGLLQYIQNQRYYNRGYEAMGILDLAQKCTKWPAWTRFSTVVHHRPHSPLNGSPTLNMGSTTFTYKTIEPALHDIPDLLVSSTMATSERATLSIQFPEDRVSNSFAEDALRLLVSAVEMLSCYDTLTQPMLPSSEDISRSAKQIPLPRRAEADLRIPTSNLLPNAHRIALQTLITKAWTETLHPPEQGVPEAGMHQVCFYNLGGSLLSAHFLAEYLNQELPSLSINGLDKVHITPEVIIDNPSMLTQFEFIVRKLRSDGSLSLPTRRRTMNFRSDRSENLGHSATAWSPKPASPSNQPLNWKSSIRRLQDHKSRSVRGLGSRAAGWMKNRANASLDSPVSRSVSVIRGNPIQDSPRRESPFREGPLRGSPFQDGPIRESPVQGSPLRQSPSRENTVQESHDLGSLGGFIGGMGVEAILEEEMSPLSPGGSDRRGMRGTLFGSQFELSPVGSRG
ncbi:Fc.00g095860.m01.CDS01 [Cosmosporella sp. VM-42]